MAIKGYTRPDSGSTGKTIKPPSKQTWIGRNPPPASTAITQKKTPPPYTGAPGGSAGIANSGAAWQAANPANARTPGSAGSGGSGWSAGSGGSGGGQQSAAPPMGYTNQGLVQTLYNRDPQMQASYALNWLIENGLPANPAIAEMVGDAIRPAAYRFAMEHPNGGGDLSDAAIAAYVNDLLAQMNTPGARLTDSSVFLDALFNAGPDSMLSNAMGYGIDTAPAQVAETEKMLQSAIYGMNPLAQRAYLNANNAMAMRYLAEANRDPTRTSSYGDYLRNSPMRNWYEGV